MDEPLPTCRRLPCPHAGVLGGGFQGPLPTWWQAFCFRGLCVPTTHLVARGFVGLGGQAELPERVQTDAVQVCPG